MFSKIILVSLLSVFSFASDSCISKSYLNGTFNDTKESTNVWSTKTNNWVKEESKFTNLFPSCKTNKLDFVQYSHRNDFQDVVLIQYIFKGTSIPLKNVVTNIVKDNEFKKVYTKSKTKSSKKLIVEFTNSSTQQSITYDNGKLISQTVSSKK